MRDVTIVYHQEPEGWWADSPQVSGYVATGETLAEVRALVRDGLPFFVGDERVEIFEALADEYLPMKVSLDLTGSLIAFGVPSYGPAVVSTYASSSASTYVHTQDTLAAV